MGSFLRYRAAQIFGLCTIFNSKMYVFNFDQKKSLATFWATFSQTHLVALIRSDCEGSPEEDNKKPIL
jgi:hypothetical protein